MAIKSQVLLVKSQLVLKKDYQRTAEDSIPPKVVNHTNQLLLSIDNMLIIAVFMIKPNGLWMALKSMIMHDSSTLLA